GHFAEVGGKTGVRRGDVERADRASQRGWVDAGRIGAHSDSAPIRGMDNAARRIGAQVQELVTAGQERAHVHRRLQADDISAKHPPQDGLPPTTWDQPEDWWVGKGNVGEVQNWRFRKASPQQVWQWV